MVTFNGGRAMVLVEGTWFNVGDVYEVRPNAPETPAAASRSDANENTETANSTDNNTES